MGMIALDGVFLGRSVDGAVELAEASPANRSFPARVTESLGICLKVGPDHRVVADGRVLVYPEGSICVRPPGCVWAAASTGLAGFLSLDIGSSLLPLGLAKRPMAFVPPGVLPSFRWWAESVRRAATAERSIEIITELLVTMEGAGLLSAEESRATITSRTARRARDALECQLHRPPSIVALAQQLGTNRFSLMRAFKRQYGITPHAFALRLRIERARHRIAGGGELGEVAHELGFADQPHLTRVFKKIVGITPGEYARSTRALSFKTVEVPRR